MYKKAADMYPRVSYYVNAGMTAYLLKRYDLMEEFYNKAIERMKQTGSEYSMKESTERSIQNSKEELLNAKSKAEIKHIQETIAGFQCFIKRVKNEKSKLYRLRRAVKQKCLSLGKVCKIFCK